MLGHRRSLTNQLFPKIRWTKKFWNSAWYKHLWRKMLFSESGQSALKERNPRSAETISPSGFEHHSFSSQNHRQRRNSEPPIPQFLTSLLGLIKAVCNAVAEIIFLRGTVIGVILLGAMLLQPSVLFMGIVGLLAALGCAAIMELESSYLQYGPLLFNPLLAGLGVGYLFQITPAAMVLAGIAGALAFVLTWASSHILRTFLLLPVLSLPFVTVSWLVHLAAFRYAGLLPALAHPHTYTIGEPEFIEGFLRTLGLIFFLPNIWVGVIIAVLMFCNSRIQFLLALGGYALGTYVKATLTGTFVYVYHDPAALNFILVALAIGGFYLIPSPRSYGLAAVGVVFTALIGEAVSVFWAAVGLPVHAFPYNLVTLTFLYILGSVGQKLLARYPQATPEKTLDYELTHRLRHRRDYYTIDLPFTGKWKVWQGIDGPWTHQGLWRYAYDFVLCDESGSHFRHEGSQLTDYYAFQKPVLAPVSGWVTRVVTDLPDCAVGTVDQTHNWGNYVILYDERGFYVEISHFAQNTIMVKAGERIQQGALLGRCGNSGYSPQPHIHIQVQLSPEIGAATVPFSFTNLRINGQFSHDATPLEEDLLEPVTIEQNYLPLLSLTLDTAIEFVIEKRQLKAKRSRFHQTKNHQLNQLPNPSRTDIHDLEPYLGEAIPARSKTHTLYTVVKMAADGTFYLDSGKGQLYFSQSERCFISQRLAGNDPWLSLVFLAMPRLPATMQLQQSWSDYVPISLVTEGFQRISYQMLSSVYPKLASAQYQGQWLSPTMVQGMVTIWGDRRRISSTVRFISPRQISMIVES